MKLAILKSPTTMNTEPNTVATGLVVVEEAYKQDDDDYAGPTSSERADWQSSGNTGVKSVPWN